MTTTTASPTHVTAQPGPSRHPYPTARIAGVLYVVIVVFGLVAEVGVRSALIAPGDPLATASNIADSQWLFRAGFAAELAAAELLDAVDPALREAALAGGEQLHQF